MFLGSVKVFIMALVFLPKAKHSFRCCFGGKAVQCYQKDFQCDEQEDFGIVCDNSRDSLTKLPIQNQYLSHLNVWFPQVLLITTSCM